MTEHEADVDFLVHRAVLAGICRFSDSHRDYGLSSNSIVSIAYGLMPLEEQEMPSDRWDLAACERMWRKLPEHRKTENAVLAMDRARENLRDP